VNYLPGFSFQNSKAKMLAASTVIKDVVCCCAKNVKLTSKESSSKNRQNFKELAKNQIYF